jgi:RNA polymerase sigma factor (sigma-70 family)
MVDSRLSDRELLDRFLARHDEQAFEILIRRHDRLVRSAIGKVLGNTPAAEDAYQAAFLVLVRRSRTIQWRTGLGPWLYGVAHRVAVKARTHNARVARLESTVRPGQPILPADLSWLEACDLLHAELDRLPDQYRMPLLLCYLEGKTREEAAAALGISTGTVKGRVRRGCDLLRDRLSRRGVALSVGLLATLATSSVIASTRTAPAAVIVAIRGAASGRVRELAQEIIMGTILSKITKLAAVAVLSTGLVAALVAATGLAAQSNPPQPQAALKEGAAQDKAKADVQAEPLPAGARLRLGTLDWRHAGGFVSFTPDGKAILTSGGKAILISGGDDSIRLLNRETGKEIRRFSPAEDKLPGRPREGMSVAMSKDGKLLAAAYSNRGIAVWELETGKELPFRAMVNGDGILEFTPNGKVLAFRGLNLSTRLFEVATGKELDVIQGQRQAGAFLPPGYNPGSAGMAISADGKAIATANVEDNRSVVNLNALKTGKVTQQLEENQFVTAVAYSPDGKMLAYATGPSIVLRDAKTTKEIRRINGPLNITGLVFAPDSKALAAKAIDQFIRVWDTETGKETHVLGEGFKGDTSRWMQPSLFKNFAFSPDSKFIVASAESSLRMWDLTTAKEVPLSSGHRGPVTSLAVTPDGKTVISRGGDKLIRWDAATGKELSAAPVNGGLSLGMTLPFATDARTLALVIGDTISLVDVATGKEQRRVQGNGKYVGAIALSPDGKMVASQRLEDIRLHDARTGFPLKQVALPAFQPKQPNPRDVRPPKGPGPMALAFSPDSQTLVGLVEQTLRFWDATTAKEIAKIELPQPATGCLAYAPDGRVLAVENEDQTITLWETAIGQPRRRLGNAVVAEPASLGRVTSTLVFSPDGSLLATRAGGEIVIFDVTAAKEIARVKTHQDEIMALAFFPDGKALVSGGADTTSLVWDTADWKRAPAPPAAELQPKDLESLWADLADEDAARAFRSILKLASAAKLTVPYLGDHLKPAAPVDAKVIEKLIADLDSADFKTRNQASKELEKLGEAAVPALREALAGKVPLETRQRIEPILTKLASNVLNADQVRLVRAVEVLERLATPEARQVLQTLADGAPGALPTRHARAALNRLDK